MFYDKEYNVLEPVGTNMLKYGFCKKLIQYKWTSDQLNWTKSVQLVRGSLLWK